MRFCPCPRCGAEALEKLATHSYCFECNYYPEHHEELCRWRKIEFPTQKVRDYEQRTYQRLGAVFVRGLV